MDLALRDLKIEGHKEEEVRFALELEMRYGMQYNYTKIESPPPADSFTGRCERHLQAVRGYLRPHLYS